VARDQHRARVRLQRSLQAISVGHVKGRERLRAELAPMEAGDMAQAVHVPVKGKAGTRLAMTDLRVTFAYHFLTKITVGDDEDEPTEPTFGSGVELRSDAPVMIDVVLRDWIEDDRGLVTGAKVRVQAIAPGVIQEQNFNAVVHLTFTGYAAPAEDDDDGVGGGIGRTTMPSNVPGFGTVIG
jgi:hypothetical protein